MLPSVRVEDVLMAVCDGLKGLPDAIGEVWPRTVVQTCVIHLLRASFRYASRAHWDATINASPQEHFPENQTCFHCLAGADVIGNQQIDPRKAQGLPQWKKLVGVLVDAGPEWGLK